MRFFPYFLTFFALHAASAHAWEISALGGLNYSAPTENKVSGPLDWTGNAALAYGASVSYTLFESPFELETGAFMLSSETDASINNADTVRKMKSFQIPILLRFNFDPWISLAAGGYFSFADGSVETITNSAPVRQSYGAAGLKTSDAGLILGLKAKLHIDAALSLVFDVRYQHGLKNMASNSGELYNTRAVQALAGFGYEFEFAKSAPEQATSSRGRSNSE